MCEFPELPNTFFFSFLNRRKYVISVPQAGDFPSEIFDYGETDVFKCQVQKVVRSRRLTLQDKETQDPTAEELAPPKSYTIHKGYHRVLLGFIQEIKFMTEDGITNHNCLFRAVYLTMVLDFFVDELEKIIPTDPSSFRSRTLNPILQRQLRGVSDHEARAVKAEVGNTLGNAGSFYLQDDPLDPDLICKVFRNILYVWHVRLALGYLGTGLKATEASFTTALRNTQDLLSSRGKTADEEWDDKEIMIYESKLAYIEGLGPYYEELFVESVSAVDAPSAEQRIRRGAPVAADLAALADRQFVVRREAERAPHVVG